MSDGPPALLVSSDFPPVPGGQSRYLSSVWAALPPGAAVVLAPALPGTEAYDAAAPLPVHRIRLPLGPGRLRQLARTALLLTRVEYLCRQGRVGSLHCGQVLSAGLVGWACSRGGRRRRYYPYVHGADLLEFRHRLPWGPLLQRILGQAHRVVVNSRFSAAAVASCGVPPERIVVIHPPVDMHRFAALPDRERWRRSLGWEASEVILSVGRLVARKGQDTVIRALPQIVAAVPSTRYVVVGSGPQERPLAELARAVGVADRVEFRGFAAEEELAGLYAAADVFAMVSRHRVAAGDVEGFGIVYLEANAAGLAVVAGRSGGVEDAVVDGQTGLLVDPESVAETGAALVHLLGDKELSARLATQGRARAARDFAPAVQAQRLWEACP
jgi:phosphatidylinositol alpha-1,6-mannosyltransferase